MICNVFLGMCIVGLTQVGPALYKVEVMDAEQEVHALMCRESDYIEVSNVLKF